jgi:hypothetical protein
MKQNETNLVPKSSEKYTCTFCDYKTCRQSQLNRHNSTVKHKLRLNETFETKPHLKDLVSSLYLIEFTDGVEHFWKVGITRRSVEKRIRKIPYEMVSFTTITGKLFDMYKKEKQIKRYNKEYRYYPSKFFNGHSECFSQPINIE